MSQLHLNVCTWIKADSTNGRKQVPYDDATKCFSSAEQQFQLTYSNHSSIGILNMQ